MEKVVEVVGDPWRPSFTDVVVEPARGEQVALVEVVGVRNENDVWSL